MHDQPTNIVMEVRTTVRVWLEGDGIPWRFGLVVSSFVNLILNSSGTAKWGIEGGTLYNDKEVYRLEFIETYTDDADSRIACDTATNVASTTEMEIDAMLCSLDTLIDQWSNGAVKLRHETSHSAPQAAEIERRRAMPDDGKLPWARGEFDDKQTQRERGDYAKDMKAEIERDIRREDQIK